MEDKKTQKNRDELRFEVQYPPLSVNRLYRISRVGKLYKVPEARRWEKDFYLLLPSPHGWWAEKRKKPRPIGLRLIFYVKNCSEIDLDNQLKILIDVLEKKYNFNDSWIHYMETVKFESEENKIVGYLFIV